MGEHGALAGCLVFMEGENWPSQLRQCHQNSAILPLCIMLILLSA